jgi:predicted dehydrogenase
MAKTKPIRLAVIRCDIHAYWFLPFLVRTDPNELREGCAFVHRLHTDGEQQDKFIIKRVGGFKLVNVWDQDPKTAQQFAASFKDRPRVCKSLKEAAQGVDAALIANCSFDGSDHLQLASPLLKAGLPVFIDKPFAENIRDAKAIIRLAEKHNAPLMAASLLHYADELKYFRARRAEIGDIKLGIVHGSHGWETPGGNEGITHSIATAMHAFGDDVESVESIGNLPRQFILLHYPGGKQIMIINKGQTDLPDKFIAESWGNVHIQSVGAGGVEFLAAGTRMLSAFKKMVRTGKTPTPHEKLLKWIRIGDAAHRAQQTGKRVTIKSVR